MATIFDAFLGAKEEVTYGTAIAVDKFYEFTSEGIEGKYERIESEALRAGTKFGRTDRFAINPKGAEGDVELEVTTRQFGFWLKQMLGSVSSGTATLGVTKHTFTPGDLNGKSFTMQVGRPGSSGTVHPFTYEGGKVAEWELKNSVDGVLMLTATCDFEAENTTGAGAYALATPTYPASDNTLFTFVGGDVQIGGTQFKATDVSVKGSNGLKTDRYFIGAPNAKREPLESELRTLEFELSGEFEDLTQYNRVKSATAAGALASVTLTWTGLAVGAGGIPTFKVTLPAARFDTGAPSVDGRDLVDISLGGKALFDGTLPAITVEYTTPDTTV